MQTSYVGATNVAPQIKNEVTGSSKYATFHVIGVTIVVEFDGAMLVKCAESTARLLAAAGFTMVRRGATDTWLAKQIGVMS